MAFSNEKEQLYLESHASGVGLGASLLQARDVKKYPQNEAPNNAGLQPKAFASKSLWSAETHYSIME